MPETLTAPVETKETVKEPIIDVNPFQESNWKTEITPEKKIEPIVEKKEEKVADDKNKVQEKKVEPVQVKVDEKKNDVKEQVKSTPFEFKNEASKRYFELIEAGEEKEDELLEFLSEKKTLKNIDKMTPADTIKLDLKYKNKDFDPNEINDLFEEKYSLPEKPEQEVDEEDADFEARNAKYEKQVLKIDKQIARDAKSSKAELLKYKQEISLPNIPKAEPKIKEPTQEELDKFENEKKGFMKEFESKLDSFDGFKTVFKDEEVEIPVSYIPTKEEKEAIKPIVESLYKDYSYLENRWANEDGTVNIQKVTADILRLEFGDRIDQKLVSETGNKRYAENIKKIKNVDVSGEKRNPNVEITDREKQDGMAKHFFSN